MSDTLLIADSDVALGERYRQFFKPHGYRVEISLDALDCVEKLRRLRPCALVLDLDLQWGGSAGVLAWLRDDGPSREIPTVLTVTRNYPLSVARCLVGPPIIACLLKPFAPTVLLRCVRSSLETNNESVQRCRPTLGVLVADDEHLVRNVVGLGLEKHGFDCWLAANGREAISLYREHRDDIAVVLLDVCMPGLDGPHTLDALQRLNPGVFACFMTGDTGAYDPTELIECGGAYVFSKPFRLGDLAKFLRMLVYPASDGAFVAGGTASQTKVRSGEAPSAGNTGELRGRCNMWAN